MKTDRKQIDLISKQNFKKMTTIFFSSPPFRFSSHIHLQEEVGASAGVSEMVNRKKGKKKAPH